MHNSLNINSNIIYLYYTLRNLLVDEFFVTILSVSKDSAAGDNIE